MMDFWHVGCMSCFSCKYRVVPVLRVKHTQRYIHTVLNKKCSNPNPGHRAGKADLAFIHRNCH